MSQTKKQGFVSDKFKKGEKTALAFGFKTAGRNLWTFPQEGEVAIRSKSLRFKDLTNAELALMNVADGKDYHKLLKEIRKVYPDFEEHEIVTLVYAEVEGKSK